MGTRNTKPSATKRARKLRLDMSNSEKRLWAALRRRSLFGWRFRRQFPVGPYVIDFYCPSLRLAVEVDGTHHRLRKAQDEARDQFLQTFDIETIRFRTVDVIENLDRVCIRLKQVCDARAGLLNKKPGRVRIRKKKKKKAPPP